MGGVDLNDRLKYSEIQLREAVKLAVVEARLEPIYTEKQMQDAITVAALKSANETVSKFAATLGINIADEKQLELLKLDRMFLRSLRGGRDAVNAKIGMAILLATISAFMAMMYEGAIALLHRLGP